MESSIIKRQHNRYFPSKTEFDTKVFNNQEEDLMFQRRDVDQDWCEALELLDNEIECVVFPWEDEEIYYQGKLVEEIVVIGPNQYAIGWMTHDITMRDLVQNLEIRVTTKKRLSWEK